MRRFLPLFVATSAAFLLTFLPLIVALAYTYRAAITVTETNGTAYTKLGVTTMAPNTFLAANGFMLSTALDARVETLGGLVKPTMVANDRTMFVDDIPANSQINRYFTTGNTAATSMSIVPGYNGTLTTADAAALEPGADFSLAATNVQLSKTAAGTFVDKLGAYNIATDGAGNVSGAVGNGGLHLTQVLTGGGLSGLANNQFYMLEGSLNAVAEASVYEVIPTAGSISNLAIKLSANVGAGATATFTLYVDGSPSALTTTIAAGASTGSDTTNSVTVTAGQTVSLKCTTTGVPGAPNVSYSTQWTSTNANESILLFNTNALSGSTIYVIPVGQSYQTTAAQADTPMPTAGTFSKMLLKLSADPGNAPDAYTFTMFKNTVASSITTSIVADNVTGSDTTHTVSVVAGDLISIQVVPVDVPVNSPSCGGGLVFTPTTAGESVIMGGYVGSTPSNAATNYHSLVGGGTAGWNATETNVYERTNVQELSKFYIRTNTAPTAGKSFAFTVLDNGVSTGITTTVNDAEVTDNDTTHSYTTANGALMDVRSVPNGAPTTGYYRWSMISKAPGATVTKALATTGQHSLSFSLAAGTLSLSVDGGAAATAASPNVPDNGNSISWLSNNVPTADSIALTVSGVEVLKYSPIAIIASTSSATNAMGGAVAFNATGSVYTTETTAANSAGANDMTLLPAVPSVNCAYYFGSPVQFSTLTINIGTNGSWTGTYVWEYLKLGGTWTALTGVTDGTTGFTSGVGSKTVTWVMPTDWMTSLVNTVGPEYWVRFRVATYTAIVTQPKGTQSWTTNALTAVLPDRDGGDQNGTITWGTNPVNMAVVLGGIVSSAQASAGGSSTTPTPQDLIGATEMNREVYEDPDVSGVLAANPFRPFAQLMSSGGGMTELQAWRWLGSVFVLLAGVGGLLATKGHIAIAGIAAGVAIGLMTALTIYPWFAMIIAVALILACLVSERSPSV